MNWGILKGFCAAAILIAGLGLGIAGFQWSHEESRNPQPVPLQESQFLQNDVEPVGLALSTNPASLSEPRQETLVVSVVGGVLAPGLYRLPVDSRIQDAIDAAGGVAQDADVTDINIAAYLRDGWTLNIPRRSFSGMREGVLVVKGNNATARELNPPEYTRSGWQPDSSHSVPSELNKSSAYSQASGPINLNSASQSDLESLPGIGPVTASKIITYREHTPFQQVEDLMNIHGIGAKKLESLLPLVSTQ